LAGRLFEAEKPLVLGEQVVAAPDAADAAGAHLHPAEHEVVGGALGAVARVIEGVGEDGILDLLADAVGVRTLGAGEPVEQPLGAVGLEVPADLVELLTAVAHDLAGLRHVPEFLAEL
jgi:hypothetical protein